MGNKNIVMLVSELPESDWTDQRGNTFRQVKATPSLQRLVDAGFLTTIMTEEQYQRFKDFTCP